MKVKIFTLVGKERRIDGAWKVSASSHCPIAHVVSLVDKLTDVNTKENNHTGKKMEHALHFTRWTRVRALSDKGILARVGTFTSDMTFLTTVVT